MSIMSLLLGSFSIGQAVSTAPCHSTTPCHSTRCLRECDQRGENYKGTVAITRNGKACQPWNTNTPHVVWHAYRNMFIDGSAKNYCRNPNGDGTAPWCYTTDPNTKWEYCDIPKCYCLSESDPIGKYHMGTVNKTKSGKTCQAWKTKYPHVPSSGLSRNLLDGSAKAAKNYCRNPYGNGDLPWCYTTDPNTRWEYCDIPQCISCKSKTCLRDCDPTGEYYMGTVDKTISGKTCQAWNTNTPHVVWHEYPNELIDGSAAAAKNYCRNPLGKASAPWCYTTDPKTKWDYCDIPKCFSCKSKTCLRDCDPTGEYYMGTVDKTISGKKCQAWNTRTPHVPWHEYLNELIDGSAAAAKNYCRNPLGQASAPWCYTTDPKTRWDYCDIPKCYCLPGSDPTGKYYNGTVNTTVSGKTCQAWNLKSPQIPADHVIANLIDPSVDHAKNYCRNPDGDVGPWCYTTDPNKRWELCAFSECRCGSKEDKKGKLYQGVVNNTASGRTCQAWSRDVPHKISAEIRKNLIDGNADKAKNYCRNPDNDSSPWCYTTDPNKEREHCNIPQCA